jgi:hypothetical protein
MNAQLRYESTRRQLGVSPRSHRQPVTGLAGKAKLLREYVRRKSSLSGLNALLQGSVIIAV